MGKDGDGDFFLDFSLPHIAKFAMALPGMKTMVEDVLGLDRSKFKVNLRVAPKGKMELFGVSLRGLYHKLKIGDMLGMFLDKLDGIVKKLLDRFKVGRL